MSEARYRIKVTPNGSQLCWVAMALGRGVLTISWPDRAYVASRATIVATRKLVLRRTGWRAADVVIEEAV